ncbi:MAG: ABC transporter ATP-binding protein [bacterium]|nr:ABC transporter ATP-binding protein [bacterium]
MRALEACVAAGREQMGQGEIKIEHVTKRFRRSSLKRGGYTSLKSSLLNCCRGSSAVDDKGFVALDDISLHIPAGKALGVIGRNGSGKSTLLKLIAGIYQPDLGSVSVEGRVSALIELGAGFHPDFTGRENLYLGGVMYGLSRREISRRFDDIVQYAELENFIDDPVRTYSSGMYMRLGFSLAVFTDPDILLIDEVLAVGDASFVHRCHDTISEFRRRGKTLLFVTHDLASIDRWCEEAMWLHKGVVKLQGTPRRVIDSYLSELNEEEEAALERKNQAVTSEQGAAVLDAGESDTNNISYAEYDGDNRWGNREVEITSVRMLAENGEERWVFDADDSATVEVHYRINSSVTELVFGVGVQRSDGLNIHGTNTDIDKVEVPLPDNTADYPVCGSYTYRMERLGLSDDSYFLDVAVHREDGTPYDYHHRLYKFRVNSQRAVHGIYSPRHVWGVGSSHAA